MLRSSKTHLNKTTTTKVRVPGRGNKEGQREAKEIWNSNDVWKMLWNVLLMWVLLQRVLLNSAVPHSPPQIDQYQGSEVKHKGERTLRVCQTVLYVQHHWQYPSVSFLSHLSIAVTFSCASHRRRSSRRSDFSAFTAIFTSYSHKKIQRRVQKNANLEILACHLSKIKPSKRISFDA